MRVEKDFEDLLRLFNKHRVRYCIIGAFAVAYYAKPRYTKDLDILIDTDSDNAKRIVNALNEFSFRSLGLKPDDFSKSGKIIQLGYEPVRIDILTSISGCKFHEVWKNKEIGRYGTQRVNFIGLNELIKNKKASRRKQDKVDLDLLMKAKARKAKR